jgi:hypothetical protein
MMAIFRCLPMVVAPFGGRALGDTYASVMAAGHEFRREVQHLERFEPYRFFPLPRSRIRISGIRQSGDVERKILPFPGEPEHWALHFASESTGSAIRGSTAAPH